MPDETLLKESQSLAARVARDFVAGRARAFVVQAAAGAGKSGLVTRTAGAVGRAGLRLAIAAPTNAQVADLVRRVAREHPRLRFTYLHAEDVVPEPDIVTLPNVRTTKSATSAVHDPIVLATLHKFAFSAADVGSFDRLIIDEAYQADSTQYLCIAGLADSHLLVGDSGQLDPFSIADCTYWRGQSEDPLLTAIGVLLKNHIDIPVLPLPLTRRLAPSAVAVVGPAFYPRLAFAAASLAGERELRIGGNGRPRDPVARAAEKAIERASAHGWAHVLLPATATLSADPETAGAIVAVVHRLLAREPQIRDERDPSWQPLGAGRIAVAVSHNDQKDLLRLLLDEHGLDSVLVDTANRLQGLEFDVTVAWHPLSGLPDLDEFHLDPGRLCVMTTRHRHACIVVGRAGDREHVLRQPPTTPAYLGWDPDPLLDGWDAHRQVFESLEEHVIPI